MAVNKVNHSRKERALPRKYTTTFGQGNTKAALLSPRRRRHYDASLLEKKPNSKENKDINNLTPYVNGMVVLSYPNGKNVSKPYLLVELDFRNQKKWRDVPVATKNAMKEKELRYSKRR